MPKCDKARCAGLLPCQAAPSPEAGAARADGGVITPWGCHLLPSCACPGLWHSQGQEASQEPGHPLKGLSNSLSTAQPHPQMAPGHQLWFPAPGPLLTSWPVFPSVLMPHPLPPALQLPKFCPLSPSCGSQTPSQRVKPIPSATGQRDPGAAGTVEITPGQIWLQTHLPLAQAQRHSHLCPHRDKEKCGASTPAP